jgi:AmpD protein
MTELDDQGWLHGAMQIPSPNCDARPVADDISLLVIHSISLPPETENGPGITALFTNSIDPDGHPYFHSIAALRVSSHALIRRDGGLVQYVPFARRAWHAGVSSWLGRPRCNDFSIGVELEGTDHAPFTEAQYATLNRLIEVLVTRYPIAHLVAHSEIAPGRKTDPGPFFDWLHLSLRRSEEKKVDRKFCKVLA